MHCQPPSRLFGSTGLSRCDYAEEVASISNKLTSSSVGKPQVGLEILTELKQKYSHQQRFVDKKYKKE